MKPSYTCSQCGARVAPFEFHSCGAPSYHAPWLADALAEAFRPLTVNVTAPAVSEEKIVGAVNKARLREKR